MKKLLVTLLLCAPFCKSIAQIDSIRFDTTGYYLSNTRVFYTPETDTSPNPYAQNAHTLHYLDMHRVPHRVLFDKVPSLSGLAQFEDFAIHRPVSNALNFHQAYYEYYNAKVDPTPEISPDTLIKIIDSNYNGNIHPFIFFKANISSIKNNAVHDHLLRLDSSYQLHDNGDSIISAYDTHSVTLASIGANTIDLQEGIHQIVLDPRFFVGNDTVNIKEIALHFSNGTPNRTFSIDGVARSAYSTVAPVFFNVNHADSIITITANVKLNSGVILSNKFIVKNGNRTSSTTGTGYITIEGCDGADSFVITGPLLDPGLMYDYGPYVDNHAGVGTYYIFYSTANSNCAMHTVTNPVIFIDGYDPTNSRRVDQIYSKYLNVSVDLGGTTVKLADKLRADGYDIIIVDYQNGADYIERNATMLAAVLKDIYIRFPHAADNVLIGPSYGALVAQYCLASMETWGGIPHHVRDFISFDGPHQGANVPIGVQKLIQYLTSGYLVNSLAAHKIDGVLQNTIENPAARQILIHHLSAGSESEPAPDAYRTTFLNHLSYVNWWPSVCRRVAIIDGSRNDTWNPFVNPEDRLVHLIHWPWWSFGLYTSDDWSVYATSVLSRDIAMHNWTASIFGNLLLGVSYGWTTSYHTPGPNSAALDICPGSFFHGLPELSVSDQLQIIAYSTSSGSGGGITFNQVNNITFIPTVSSADYYPSPLGYNLYHNFNNEIISNCANTSTFDWVYAENTNQDHVGVDPTIAQWFINEIEQKTQDLGTYYNYITGLATICKDAMQNYSVNTVSGSNYFWSVGPGLSLVSAQGSSSMSIKSTQAFGTVPSYIQVTFVPIASEGTTNSTVTFKFDIISGDPTFHISFQQIGYTCDYEAIALPNYPGTSYTWSTDHVHYEVGSNTWGDFTPHAGAHDNVWANISTGCGVISTTGVFSVTHNPWGCMERLANTSDSSTTDSASNNRSTENLFIDNDIMVQPNPTSDDWTIQFPNPKFNGPIDILLFDNIGKTVWSFSKPHLSSNQITVPGKNLKSGIYLLQIDIGGESRNFKLVKN